MSQLPPNQQIETIRALHHDLSEVYENVSHHFEEIYPLPKKFIEQTAPVVDKYLHQFSKPGVFEGNLFVFQAIMGFMNQFDDFALMTNQLFSDYQTNLNECKTCMDKLEKFNSPNTNTMADESAKEYVELTPELIELTNRLKSVKERSEEMVKKLEKMETRWTKIKMKISE